MKTVLILNYEYPPLWWWAGVVSQKYAIWLAQLGNQVVVITTWFPWEKEFSQEWNFTIIRLKSLRKKAFQSNPIEMLSWAFNAIKFLKKYLKNNHFDISISFFSIPGGIVWKYIKEKFNIPYIVSTHWHDIPWFYPEKMKKFHLLTNWYTKKIWKQAEKILCLTTQMKQLADIFWNSSKNILLPNGCNSDFFYPDISKKWDVFTLLFVWRLVDQKDPFTMLHAIKTLKDNKCDFQLNILWDGPLRKKMEVFVQENQLYQQVHFVWWVSKEEMRNYYQKSHIQICSSKVEAMSIAILESLYSWLYILSTPISGNTDMIQEWVNGEFFDIWDYTQLANKLWYWSSEFKKLKTFDNVISRLQKDYSRDNIILKLNQYIK